MKKYKLELVFNGETFKKRVMSKDNLKKAFMSMKQDFVHTEGYIAIAKGELVFQRKLPLVKLRKLFVNPDELDMFIDPLIF